MATSSMLSEHRIPTPRGEIYVQDHAGAGDAFVLMHGFPDNHHIYDELVPHLTAAGRRVVAFDFPGFGDSEKSPFATYSFDQQLDDLRAVVHGLDLGRVIPVGHDASGPAAINFALQDPDNVASLCLLNSFYAAVPSVRLPELIALFATDSLNALAAAVLGDVAQLTWLLHFQQERFLDAMPEPLRPHFRTTLAPIINQNFTDGSGRAFAQMAAQVIQEVGRNTARVPELKTLRAPVEFIFGQHDPYLGGVARELVPHFANATLHLLPTGHWPQSDMPQEVARRMLAADGSRVATRESKDIE